MLKTKDDKIIDVEELTWLEVIKAITPINPNLANVIGDLMDNSNDDSFSGVCYKANYQFGSK